MDVKNPISDSVNKTICEFAKKLNIPMHSKLEVLHQDRVGHHWLFDLETYYNHAR